MEFLKEALQSLSNSIFPPPKPLEKEDEGNTPLQELVRQEQLEQLVTFLNNLPIESIETTFFQLNSRGCNVFHTCSFKNNNSCLILLIEYLQKHTTKKVIEELLNQKTRPEGHWTPLFISASKGHLEICRTILNFSSSSINIPDEAGRTPMMAICCNNWISLVDVFLKHKPSLLHVDQKGRNCLYFSCRNGNEEIVKNIIKYFEQTKEEKEEEEEELNIFKFLNIKDSQGYTALHMGCLSNNYEIVKTLIDQPSTDLSLTSSDGSTALHVLCRNSSPDLKIANLLLQSKSDNIKKRINLRKKGSFGRTILHDLCRQYHTNFVELVLSASIETERIRKKEMDSLKQKNSEIIDDNNNEEEEEDDDDDEEEEQKLKHFIDLQDSDGMTALHVACTAFKLFSSEELEKKKENIFSTIKSLILFDSEENQNEEPNEKDTFETREREWERERKRYSRVNCVDYGNATPLHLSSWKVDSEIGKQVVCILLQYGADLTLEMDSGWSVFHISHQLSSPFSSPLFSIFESHLTSKISKLGEWINDEKEKDDYDNRRKIVSEWETEMERLKKYQKNLNVEKERNTNNIGYRIRSAPQNRIPKKKRDKVLGGLGPTLKAIACLFQKTFQLQSQQQNVNERRPLKIVVLTGAGVSVSSGIPDYRSSSSGIYSNENARDLFSVGSFTNEEASVEFYQKMSNIFSPILFGSVKPSIAHHFLVMLQDKGYLHRVYTQNVDMLHELAGVKKENLIEAHGSLSKFRCSESSCDYVVSPDDLKAVVRKACMDTQSPTNPTSSNSSSGLSIADLQFYRVWQRIKAGNQVPLCPICQCVLRPDVVFFGEGLSPSFFQNKEYDFKQNCDLLIVMGTTLIVYPFASLVNEVSLLTPRLLINRELTGPWKWRGDTQSEELIEKNPNEYRDASYIGEIDEGIIKLSKELGWEEELIERKRKWENEFFFNNLKN